MGITLKAMNPIIKTVDGKVEVSFLTNMSSWEDGFLKDEIASLKADEFAIKISKFRKARSLDANAYMWVLCGKLAEKLNITKDEVYRSYIKDIGVFRMVEIDEKAVDTLVHSWGLHGTGWVAEKVDHSVHDGFTVMILYYGSSTYNTKQMSRLVDGIVEDCKQQGIETLTSNELEALKGAWKGGK